MCSSKSNRKKLSCYDQLVDQKTSGFTLIELLTVIAVIGLMASIILINMNNARVKARNVKRITDVLQLRKALEIYYDENNSYPHGGLVLPVERVPNDIQDLSTFLVPRYVANIPNDPKNAPLNYLYAWQNGGQDYGIFIPFGNDGAASCKVRTGNASDHMFRARDWIF